MSKEAITEFVTTLPFQVSLDDLEELDEGLMINIACGFPCMRT